MKRDEFFEKVKDGAKVLKGGAKKVTKQVVTKTNNAVNQTKLTFAINETEGKISDVYTEIGRNVYKKYLDGGEVCENMQEHCARIDELLSDVGELKDKLAELKNSLKCSECGKFNKSGSSYCSSCGAELGVKEEVIGFDEAAEESEEPDTVKRVVTIRAKKPADKED